MENSSNIPQPKTYGPLGNLPLINKEVPTLSFCKLAEEYGPIYRFEAFGYSTVVLSGHKLVAEVCNDNRFDKSIASLISVRPIGGDGLFTSRTKEENWQKAHNILMPSFSQQAMKGYHPMMVDIASQLVQKWARLNPNETIDVPDDMTRLTLDTIGLCGFNYRFNSFYKETSHPFILSMVRSLEEAMYRGTRLPIQNKLAIKKKRQFERDLEKMFSLVDQIIAERKENGDDGKTDLLARMLNTKDPQTGERLDDENIRYQIITFLIAGHETTSGLLSFALYLLLKHPDVLNKACEEVDRVVVNGTPAYQQVIELKYIRMILNEALRLYPTAPEFSLFAKEDVTIGGKYLIKKKTDVTILLPQLHRDKEAWGEDAEQFRPERFEDMSKIPDGAYKPFGNGQRACIGMQFALHEATLVLGMLLQNFEIIDHTDYKLKIKQTLTLKPDDFTIRVRLREKQVYQNHSINLSEMVTRDPLVESHLNREFRVKDKKGSLLILYGSNMGTAESIAEDLAEQALEFGIESKISSLNDQIDQLSKEELVLIITSSYNGKPPRNAVRFVKWIKEVEQGRLAGVQFAVLGCGDRNWANTYQAVPRLIDEQLVLKGANRFSLRGEVDASGDYEKQLDGWVEQMWSDALDTLGIAEQLKEDPKITIKFVNNFAHIPLVQSYEVSHGTIIDNHIEDKAGAVQLKRSIEISLLENIDYQEGELIGIFRTNRNEDINRLLKRYGWNEWDHVILSGDQEGTPHLPLNQTVSLNRLLRYSVDLQEVVTQEQIRELAKYTTCPPHKIELESCIENSVYDEQIVKNKITILDLLEKYEACELQFDRLLEILSPVQPRFYPVSLFKRPNRVSFSIVMDQNSTGQDGNTRLNANSNYLEQCKPGEEVMVVFDKQQSNLQVSTSSRDGYS
ncbi:cytochrome P450 [Alkalihalobacterium sp. APHAB7]|uniref:cytochrome P450 n=1 Tax=Alkalihalobacterium sp. APHAB7 TaxID=3402081 RepID=UPI003AABDB59